MSCEACKPFSKGSKVQKVSIFYSNECVDKAEKGEEKNLAQAKEGRGINGCEKGENVWKVARKSTSKIRIWRSVRCDTEQGGIFRRGDQNISYCINILWTMRSIANIFFMTQMSEASQPRPPPLQRQKTGESRKSRLSCAKIAPAKINGVVANILRQEESKFLYYSWLPFKLVQMLMRISSVWLVMEFQSTFRGGADKFLSMWPNDWYQKQQIWEPKDSVHMLLIGKSLPPDSIAVLLTYIQFF